MRLIKKTNLDLPNRAKQAANLSGEYRHHKFDLGVNLTISGQRYAAPARLRIRNGWPHTPWPIFIQAMNLILGGRLLPDGTTFLIVTINSLMEAIPRALIFLRASVMP